MKLTSRPTDGWSTLNAKRPDRFRIQGLSAKYGPTPVQSSTLSRTMKFCANAQSSKTLENELGPPLLSKAGVAIVSAPLMQTPGSA